jgi:hypothetical protein
VNNRLSFQARPVRSTAELSTRPAGAVARHPAVRPAAWTAAPQFAPAARVSPAVTYPGGGRALIAARGPADGRTLCENLETRTLMSVSLDANGWTVVTPSGDTRFVYVSAAGNDGNDGLSAAAPVATFARARTLARSGMPDQILLRRGDTFNQTFSAWNLSGRSAQEPFVIGAYTDPAAPSSQRPKVASGNATGFSGANKASTPVSNVYILGVAFEANNRNYRQPNASFSTAVKTDANGGTYGVNVLGTFNTLLVEDCSFQYYRTNLALQAGSGSVTDVKVRRNQILDAYVPNVDQYGITLGPANDATSEGIYAEGVNGLTIDGNVLDHNGWTENNALGAIASIYNHNLYLNAGNSNVVVANNVIADGASHGLQMRAGGIVTNNVFLRNAIHMSFGYVNGAGKAGGVSGEISGNVFLEDRDISGSARGYALELANLKSAANGGGTLVRNNVFAADSQRSFATIRLDVPAADNPAAQVGINDLTIEGNLIYAWYRGISINSAYTFGGTGYKAINNLVVRNNDIQRQFAGAIVDHGPSFNPFAESWTNNRYDSTLTESSTTKWFKVGSAQVSAATWQAAYEPTAALAQGAFPDPTRGVGAYNGTRGGAATTDAFLAEARRQSKAFWRTSYTTDPVIDYVRTGFAGGRIDLAGPTASAASANVTIGGGATQTVTVTYADDNQLNLASIGNGDVTVVGPNGYAAAATFVSMTGSNEGTKRVVTYSVATPGGAWSAAANGLYSVVVQPGEVLDASGKGSAAGEIGSFAVAIDPAVPMAAAVAPSISADAGPATVTVTYTGAASPPLAVSVAPANAGFETPHVGDGGTQFNPAGGGWEFAGTAGVAGNGGPFTGLNPSAPQGGQVAFLQNASAVTQTVPDWIAGTYTVSFLAAQRIGLYAGQDVQVLVDGQVVGTVFPVGSAYQPYGTAAFAVAAGPHTVSFVGLNSAGGDNTLLLDDVQIVGTTPGGQQVIAGGTLDAADLAVTAANGSVVAAAVAATSTDAVVDGTQRVVTYTVPAPAGGWAAAAGTSGSLSITTAGGQVLTTTGVPVPAGKIGTLKVAVNAPTAAVAAGDVTAGTFNAQAFTVTYTDNAPGILPSLDSGDLRVTGPNGFNAPAALVGTNDGLGTPASPLVATYTVAPPAGGWSAAGNGTYFVLAQANQVTDAEGNALPAGAIGTFKVAIDVTAPVMWSDTPDITLPTAAGVTPAVKTIGISYFDVSGVNAATVDDADVRVVGPNGYDQPTVKTFLATSSTATYANYALTPPVGGWKSSYNGAYSVVVQPNQVFDKAGNALAGGKTVVTFNVALETVPPTVAVSVTPTPRNTPVPSVTFTFSEAVSGFDLSDLVFTRGGTPVSLATATLTTADNVTYTLGNLTSLTSASGTYALTLPAETAGVTDLAGNPLAFGASTGWTIDLTPPTASSVATNVTAAGTAGATITVTYADTTGVDAATFGTSDLLVTGPAGYAAAATFVSSTASGITRTAVYSAPAPAGGWKSANNGTYAVALQAFQVADTAGNFAPAAALGSFAVSLETAPPTASASAPTVTTPGAAAQTVTVVYADNVGVDVGTLGTGDVVVTGPNGYAATATFVGSSGAATARSAVYTVPAPAGGWKSVHNGTYTIALAANQVADTAGNVAAAGLIGSFAVALDATAPTVAASPVSPNPRPTPVDAVTFTFSKPVVGFDLADLSLTRGGAGVSLAGATVTTADNVTFVVGPLAAATAPAGSYVLTLAAAGSGIVDAAGNPLAAGTAAAFTVVAVAPPDGNLLANPGFESPAVGSGGGAYLYHPAPAGWVFDDGSGVTGNFSAFTYANPVAPEGGQVAFVQGGGSVAQVVNTAGGGYTLSFRTAQRGGGYGLQTLDVRVDGVSVGTFAPPPSLAYAAVATAPFALASGNHTLSIVGLVPADVTAFVDDVRLAPVPAPAAAVAAVATPRTAAVDALTVTFTRPVAGFDLSDLTLTRDGSGVPLADAGATLTTADGTTYTVGNLSAATAAVGQYALTLAASTSGIVDGFGLPLAADAGTTWVVVPPAPAPTVTGVNPATAFGSPFAQDLTVFGANFGADAVVTLRNLTTGAVVSNATVVARSDGQLVVRGALGATAANWTAEVSGAGGTSAAVPFAVANQLPIGVGVARPAGGTTAALSAQNAVGAGLTYTWSATAVPAGAPAVTFAANATGAAANTTATFGKAGTYTLNVRVSDGTTSVNVSVTVTVDQQLTQLVASPAAITVAAGKTQQFGVIGVDQFLQQMATTPTATWALTSGVGSVTAAGLYTAPASGSGSAVLRATSGGVTTTATVTVPAGFTLWVDFTTAAATVDAGYVRDAGAVYGIRGNGYTYGWNVSHADAAVDRNKNANQLVDTSIGVKTNGKWEAAVANGTYTVLVGVGDSGVATTNTVRVEGTTAFSAVKLAANAFSTKTLTVTVKDGKLTIDAGSAANLATRLTYLKITKV